MKYSKKRALEQTNSSSLKYITLAIGETLKFVDKKEGSFPGRDGKEVANDMILSENKKGEKISVPVREYLRMTLQDGAKHYESEENDDDVKFPASITVVSSTDRLSKTDGTPVYPLFSYNEADAFLKGDIEWNDLVASGIKADNTFKPVQDYVVTVN